jgi:hypothetical protein
VTATSTAPETTSDGPVIETRIEPASVPPNEIEGEGQKLERASGPDDYATVKDSEILQGETRPEDASVESGPETAAISQAPALVADQTPRPSEGDIPDFRPRRRGRAVVAAVVASAAVVVVAGGAWNRLTTTPKYLVHYREVPAERAPAKAPAPPNPTPAPPPAATVATAAAAAPAAEKAGSETLEKAVSTVTVTVKTFPEESVIFRAGKRLGSGVVEVDVERGVKERFTALHDGYLPSNFIVDGSRDTVTVRLKRPAKPRPAPGAQDNPYGAAPGTDATTASAPAPTTDATATAAPPGTAAFSTEPTTQPAPATPPASTETPAN